MDNLTAVRTDVTGQMEVKLREIVDYPAVAAQVQKYITRRALSSGGPRQLPKQTRKPYQISSWIGAPNTSERSENSLARYNTRPAVERQTWTAFSLAMLPTSQQVQRAVYLPGVG